MIKFEIEQDKWMRDWINLSKSHNAVDASSYKQTIEVKTTNAKIRRMSKRRQKIAMVKRPYVILKNAYPVHVSPISEDKDFVNMTFSYET